MNRCPIDLRTDNGSIGLGNNGGQTDPSERIAHNPLGVVPYDSNI